MIKKRLSIIFVIAALLLSFFMIAVNAEETVAETETEVESVETDSELVYKLSLDKITIAWNENTLGAVCLNNTLELSYSLAIDNSIILKGWCAATYGIADYNISLVDEDITILLDSENELKDTPLRDDVIQNCINGGLSIDESDLNGNYKFVLDLNDIIEEYPQLDDTLTLLVEPLLYTNSAKTETQPVTAIRIKLNAPHLSCEYRDGHEFHLSSSCKRCGYLCTHEEFNSFTEICDPQTDERCFREYF